MNYKKKILILLAASFASFGVGWLVGYPNLIGLCPSSYSLEGVKYCGASETQEHIAAYILLVSLVFTLLFSILYFLPKSVFLSWLKFSIPYWGFVTLIFVAVIAPDRRGGLQFPVGFDIILFVVIYLLVTIPLIVIKTKKAKI